MEARREVLCLISRNLSRGIGPSILRDLIYLSTRDFPRDEMFGLTKQMRRAAVSVSSNLAEGSSRSSRTDFARFAEIAAGSLCEVVSQSVIAKRQGFLAESDYLKTYQDAERPGRMLSGLRGSPLSK